MTQDNAVSRGQFFGFGAKGAVALVAGGSILAQTTGTAFAADAKVKAVDDVAIATSSTVLTRVSAANAVPVVCARIEPPATSASAPFAPKPKN